MLRRSGHDRDAALAAVLAGLAAWLHAADVGASPRSQPPPFVRDAATSLGCASLAWTTWPGGWWADCTRTETSARDGTVTIHRYLAFHRQADGQFAMETIAETRATDSPRVHAPPATLHRAGTELPARSGEDRDDQLHRDPVHIAGAELREPDLFQCAAEIGASPDDLVSGSNTGHTVFRVVAVDDATGGTLALHARVVDATPQPPSDDGSLARHDGAELIIELTGVLRDWARGGAITLAYSDSRRGVRPDVVLASSRLQPGRSETLGQLGDTLLCDRPTHP